jgi:UV DNA damage repair endonuclease
LYEDASALNRSHADYIYEVIPHYDLDVDVEVEAKAKDLAVLKYRTDSASTESSLLLTPNKFSFE